MIRELSESAGNIVGFQVSGKLTSDDYETTLIPRLTHAIAEHGKVRALLYFDETFDGMEAGAMWDDAKFGIKHAKEFEKIAVVGGPGWIRGTVNLFKPFFRGELKTYEGDRLDDAWSWIR